MTQARSIWAMVFFTAGVGLAGCELIVGDDRVKLRENGVVEDSTCSLALDFGTDGEAALGGVTTDASGRIWLAGTYRGAFSISGQQLAAPPDGSTNMFLLALDGPHGEVKVAEKFELGPVNLGVAGIAITEAGVYVAGHFVGALDFGSMPCSRMSSGNTDAKLFVAQFDAEGHCLAIQPPDAQNSTDQVSGLVATDNRVVIAGTANNGNALFINRYKPTLAPEEEPASFPAKDMAVITPHVAALNDDQLLIAGDFVGTLGLSPGSPDAPLDTGADKTPDAFTVVYSVSHLNAPQTQAGPYLWSRRYGAPGNQTLVALAPGKNANVSAFYAAGHFENRVDFDRSSEDPLNAAGGKDALVVALDAKAGNILWSKHFGDASNQSATAIAYDVLKKAVVVAGGFRGQIDLGDQRLTNPDNFDHIFVARLTESREPRWRQAFGADGNQSVNALVANNGEVTLAGSYTGTLNFGSGCMPLINKGGTTRFFLARLNLKLP